MSCLTSSDVIIIQPTEIRNVSMDFTLLLASGVTISTVSVVSDPIGITITNVSTADGIVYFTITGGTVGLTYTIQVTITTSDSQTIIGEGSLKIRDR